MVFGFVKWFFVSNPTAGTTTSMAPGHSLRPPKDPNPRGRGSRLPLAIPLFCWPEATSASHPADGWTDSNGRARVTSAPLNKSVVSFEHVGRFSGIAG